MSKLKKITKRELNSVLGIGTGILFRKGNKLMVPDFVKLFGIDVKTVNKAIRQYESGKSK